MWKSARDPVEARCAPARAFFRQGFLVNLLNPKSVLFAAAVLIVIFPARMSALENAAVVLNHLAVELAFYTLLAVGLSTPRVSRRYLAAKVHIDRAASAVLAALGLRLLVSR